MFVTPRRVGAGALAAILFAMPLSTTSSGAFAQDQGEPAQSIAALETVEDSPLPAAAPEVRFVASEVVQEITPEQQAEDAAPADAGSLRELVVNTRPAAALAPDVMCLAQAVYFEARGEPLEGQLAVAQVIVNRSESGTFPSDYCSVVTQRGQFSFVRGGAIPAPSPGLAWDRARAIAHIAHGGLWQSEAEDALYFHARRVRPSWAGRMTARATIQNHVFYR